MSTKIDNLHSLCYHSLSVNLLFERYDHAHFHQSLRRYRFLRLGEVGYEGTFNFEVFSYFSSLAKGDTYSRETLEQACRLLYLMGRSLADIATAAK